MSASQAPPRLAVALGLWQDRPPGEALATALSADTLDVAELWIGEMATYDAFALATAIGLTTHHIPLTLGPLAVAVRDPMMTVMGAATVAHLTGRPTRIALGTSSPVLVSQWHGRARNRPATGLAESATALRSFLTTGTADLDGKAVSTRGYRMRLPAPENHLTLAAFGPAALRVAARHADRLVLALVTAPMAADLAACLGHHCRQGTRIPVAVWLPVAVTDGRQAEEAALAQVRRMLVGYLAAPGYAEMFTAAGYGETVAFARTRPHPRELLRAVPHDLVRAVSAIGDEPTVRDRLRDYAAVADQIALLPCATDHDPAGARTLTALAGPGRPGGTGT
ncbi:LLM class F420-dependent oxidoreductase [Streptomyces albus subsp. albus]|nr:LLM class F420-dependent oxidoreductase [Streptomyces albus subsp. albus]